MCQQTLLDVLNQLRKTSDRYYSVKEIRQLQIDNNIVPTNMANTYNQLNKLADIGMLEVLPRPISWKENYIRKYRCIKHTNSVKKPNSILVYNKVY